MKKLYYMMFCILLSLSVCFTVNATTYYVDKDSIGGACNNNNNGTSTATPWCTIAKANGTLTAGDLVQIRAGTYNEGIAPAANGLDNNNRITYQNYPSEIVTISTTDTGINLTERSWITISGTDSNYGIQITNIDKYLTGNNMHYCIFEYLKIGPMRNYDRFEGFQVGVTATYNWIHDVEMYDYGVCTAGGNDRGDMFYFGDGGLGGYTDSPAHHNLLEDSHIYHGGHNVFGVAGHHNMLKNNYFHGDTWNTIDAAAGCRISVIKRGTTNGLYNLIEGNRFAFVDIPCDNTFAPALKFHSNHNIVRRNFFYDVQGPGIQLAALAPSGEPYVDANYFIHNTFWQTGVEPTTVNLGVTIKGNNTINDTVLKNNIFWQITGNSINDGGANTTDANNWKETSDPFFTDAVYGSLDVDDSTYPDFTLQVDSPCIDNGGWLTTITQATGSGTVFTVDDAHYFVDDYDMPAYMGVTGDVIETEAGQSATITDVNYATNTITVNASISWTQNEGIALSYNGTAPDQGALEYGGAVVDETAPVMSSPLPAGSQPCAGDPTAATLQITTDEDATCKYDTSDDTYANLSNTYSTTGGTTHQQALSLACDASFTYYSRCQDSIPNTNDSSATHSFSIGADNPSEVTRLDTGTQTTTPEAGATMTLE